jgi:drug/metabolite transporter (DMT)-like permease
MPNLDKPAIQWTLLIFLAFIWGSSFILMKKGLLSFSWDQVASLRIVISTLFISPILFRNFKEIKKNQWWRICIAGLLGSGVPAYLFPLAQTQISSSLTGMLNSLVPLFTVVIGLLFFQLGFRWMKIAGVVLGLIGAIGLIFSSGNLNVEEGNLAYASLVVMATIMYATNINFIKTFLSEVGAVNITSFGFLFTGPFAAIHLLNTDFVDVLKTDDTAGLNLFYIVLLAVFGTAIAVILFNMLIKKVSAVFSSSVTYIIPVFAIFWGIIDGENIQTLQFVCIAIILTGIYIVNKDNQLERKELINKLNSKK